MDQGFGAARWNSQPSAQRAVAAERVGAGFPQRVRSSSRPAGSTHSTTRPTTAYVRRDRDVYHPVEDDAADAARLPALAGYTALCGDRWLVAGTRRERCRCRWIPHRQHAVLTDIHRAPPPGQPRPATAAQAHAIKDAGLTTYPTGSPTVHENGVGSGYELNSWYIAAVASTTLVGFVMATGVPTGL
jgi:hypothetical protein